MFDSAFSQEFNEGVEHSSDYINDFDSDDSRYSFSFSDESFDPEGLKTGRGISTPRPSLSELQGILSQLTEEEFQHEFMLAELKNNYNRNESESIAIENNSCTSTDTDTDTDITTNNIKYTLITTTEEKKTESPTTLPNNTPNQPSTIQEVTKLRIRAGTVEIPKKPDQPLPSLSSTTKSLSMENNQTFDNIPATQPSVHYYSDTTYEYNDGNTLSPRRSLNKRKSTKKHIFKQKPLPPPSPKMLFNNKRRKSIERKNSNTNKRKRYYHRHNRSSFTVRDTTKLKQTKIKDKLNRHHKRWYINQYLCYRVLGKGAFATVVLAINIMKNNRKYAIKVIDKSLLRRKRRLVRGQRPINMLQNIYREIAIMKKLRHPHIVRLYEVIDDPQNNKLYMIMEYMPNGSILGEKGGNAVCDPITDHEQIRSYMRDMILGVEYLHENGIIHGDIKPENLLLDNKQRLNVADFGVSFLLNNETSPNSDGYISRSQGTPAFSAPETGSKNFYAYPIDVWAMGVSLYMMITGICPFVGSGIYQTYEKIKNDNPPIPENISLEMQSFLSGILEKDPKKRLTIQQMKKHVWITDHGREELEQPLKFINIENGKKKVNYIEKRISVSKNDVEYAVNLTQQSSEMIHKQIQKNTYVGSSLSVVVGDDDGTYDVFVVDKTPVVENESDVKKKVKPPMPKKPIPNLKSKKWKSSTPKLITHKSPSTTHRSKTPEARVKLDKKFKFNKSDKYSNATKKKRKEYKKTKLPNAKILKSKKVKNGKNKKPHHRHCFSDESTRSNKSITGIPSKKRSTSGKKSKQLKIGESKSRKRHTSNISKKKNIPYVKKSSPKKKNLKKKMKHKSSKSSLESIGKSSKKKYKRVGKCKPLPLDPPNSPKNKNAKNKNRFGSNIKPSLTHVVKNQHKTNEEGHNSPFSNISPKNVRKSPRKRSGSRNSNGNHTIDDENRSDGNYERNMKIKKILPSKPLPAGLSMN